MRGDLSAVAGEKMRRERVDFTFKLDHARLRIVRRREGRCHLCSSLTDFEKL